MTVRRLMLLVALVALGSCFTDGESGPEGWAVAFHARAGVFHQTGPRGEPIGWAAFVGRGHFSSVSLAWDGTSLTALWFRDYSKVRRWTVWHRRGY